MNRHELKVWPVYFDALSSGRKTFELRRDDRTPRFDVGDVLHLREWRPPSLGDDEYGCLAHFAAEYTGRELERLVTFVARESETIPSGYCCMSIEPSGATSPAGAGEVSDAQLRWLDRDFNDVGLGTLREVWPQVRAWLVAARRSPADAGARPRFTTDPTPWLVRVEGPAVERVGEAATLAEAAELAGLASRRTPTGLPPSSAGSEANDG